MAILTPPDRETQARLRPGARVRVQVPFWLRDNERLASAELEGTVTDIRLFRKEDHAGPVGGLRSVKLDCYASVRTPNPDSQGIRHCHRCHMALTNPVSQFVGYGPDCCEHLGIPRPPEEAMPATFLESLKDIIRTNTHRDDIWFPVPRCEWTVLADRPVDETPAVPRSGWDARFSVEGNEIVLATYPEFRYRAKLVSNWKWDRVRNVWRYPASAIKAGELRDAFDGTHRVATPAFVGLLQEHAVLQQATAYKVADDLPPIPGLKVPGWMHQRRAYWFAEKLPAAALFMDMGTGKTLDALALIVNREVHRTLVVAPKKVVTERTWSTNATKFVASPMTVIEAQPKGTIKERLDRATLHMTAAGARQTVVVVNYDVLSYDNTAENDNAEDNFLAWCQAANFDLVIFDESHKLKSPTGVRAKVAWKLGELIPQRLLLTGTPAAHTPLDIWSQYMILDPGIFGKSYTRFKHRYAQTGGFQNRKIEGWSNLDEWNQKVYQLAYRVGADVLDLPPYHHIIKPCALDAKAVRAYVEMEAQMVSTFARRDPETGEVVIDRSEAANGGVKVMRLQQITSGYLRTPEGIDVRVGESKAEALACILDDLQPPKHENPEDPRSPVTEPGEPVVVFARFVHDLDVIKETALAAGFRYAEISGRSKDADFDGWKRGESDVIGVQIQAGGAGIDLTRARYAAYYSVGYSLGDYQQSLKRVHRPGQTRATTYFHLVCEGTIDDVVYGALQRNQSVVEAAMEFAAEKLKATIAEGLGEKAAVG